MSIAIKQPIANISKISIAIDDFLYATISSELSSKLGWLLGLNNKIKITADATLCSNEAIKIMHLKPPFIICGYS